MIADVFILTKVLVNVWPWRAILESIVVAVVLRLRQLRTLPKTLHLHEFLACDWYQGVIYAFSNAPLRARDHCLPYHTTFLAIVTPVAPCGGKQQGLNQKP